ncbi:hypothetical protein BDW69DRAFT_61208 [Aspergillus filifer]
MSHWAHPTFDRHPSLSGPSTALPVYSHCPLPDLVTGSMLRCCRSTSMSHSTPIAPICHCSGFTTTPRLCLFSRCVTALYSYSQAGCVQWPWLHGYLAMP